ncbi:M23 family metallopeptidase [Actinoplanes sp. CA-142083]|uniref:M23 family metallopeptidase n=1 Tax=Actinoplanes sp. CA-142083 TaxID=3239903 RepID=UPI003D909E77
MARLAARVRIPLLFLVVLVILGQRVFPYDIAWWVSVPLLGGAMALYFFVGRVRAEPVLVEPPVRGPWRAANSPASRVPSHGVHAYGQTYAIDLVFDRPGVSRPRRPADFPGFGQPLFAAAGGRVVRVSQWQRDHWGRTSVPGVLFLLAEGMVRELFGAGRVIGNHIVIDQGDGRYALYAHLRRHLAMVRPGDRVAAGQQLASCGNSGNSSEPHLHFQLMDHPRPTFAAGLPFEFAGGVPANGTFVATESSLQSL